MAGVDDISVLVCKGLAQSRVVLVEERGCHDRRLRRQRAQLLRMRSPPGSSRRATQSRSATTTCTDRRPKRTSGSITTGEPAPRGAAAAPHLPRAIELDLLGDRGRDAGLLLQVEHELPAPHVGLAVASGYGVLNSRRSSSITGRSR
jgi:hypothetical protein